MHTTQHTQPSQHTRDHIMLMGRAEFRMLDAESQGKDYCDAVVYLGHAVCETMRMETATSRGRRGAHEPTIAHATQHTHTHAHKCFGTIVACSEIVHIPFQIIRKSRQDTTVLQVIRKQPSYIYSLGLRERGHTRCAFSCCPFKVPSMCPVHHAAHSPPCLKWKVFCPQYKRPRHARELSSNPRSSCDCYDTRLSSNHSEC